MAITLNGTTGITTPGLIADSPTLTIDSANDRVGIGTTITSSVLHIYGGNNNNYADGIIMHKVGGNMYGIYPSTNNLEFRSVTGNTHIATFDYNGNVGIGTTNPLRIIDIRASSSHNPAFISKNTGNTNTGSNSVASFSAETTTTMSSGYGPAIAFDHRDTTGGYAGCLISSLANADPFGADLVLSSRYYGYVEGLRIKSSGNVGIGTDNPSSKLHVNGGVLVKGPTTPNINFSPLSGGSGNADISFDGNDLRIVSNSSSANVRINAYSRDNDFVIKQSGNIGIGTDNPFNSKLQVFGKHRVSASAKNLTTDFFVLSSNDNSSTRNELIFRQRASDNDWEIEAVEQNTAYRNVWIKNGNLKFTSGKGIDFSATADGSGTASSELLDDYEEGTWTPTISGTSGGSFTAGGANVGRYTKVGRMVTASATIHWASASYSGLAYIGGLPYACNSATNYRVAGLMGGQNSGFYATGTYTDIKVAMDWGVPYVYVIMADETITSGANYSHSPGLNSAGYIYGFTITYQAD